MARELGDQVALAAVFRDAGHVEMFAGDPVAAEIVDRRGFEILEHVGDHGHLASATPDLGDAIYAQGRYDEAAAMAEYAERLTIEGDVDAQVRVTQLKAKVLARRGRSDEAVAVADEAVRLAAGTDYLELHAHALMSQTEVLRLAGRASDAASALREAIELQRRKGNVVEEARAVAMLEDLGVLSGRGQSSRISARAASDLALAASSAPAPGSSAFAAAAPSASRERTRQGISALEPDDQAREERVPAADRIPPPLVEHALVPGAVGSRDRDPVRAPGHDPGVAAAARELPELRGSGQRLLPGAGGFAEQPRRLGGVHLHDLRSRLQGETQRLALGVECHPHPRRSRLRHQVAVAIVGQPLRDRARDREPAPGAEQPARRPP